jgi:hypothetical protein
MPNVEFEESTINSMTSHHKSTANKFSLSSLLLKTRLVKNPQQAKNALLIFVVIVCIAITIFLIKEPRTNPNVSPYEVPSFLENRILNPQPKTP